MSDSFEFENRRLIFFHVDVYDNFPGHIMKSCCNCQTNLRRCLQRHDARLKFLYPPQQTNVSCIKICVKQDLAAAAPWTSMFNIKIPSFVNCFQRP